MEFLLSDALLVLPPGEGIVPGWLLIREGLIAAIGTREVPPPEGIPVIPCGGDFIAPGLVDIHCHGAGGRDAMEALPEAFDTILRYHAGRGTTTALLTTVAASSSEIGAVLKAAGTYRGDDGAALLAGIHLEGPWFSPKRRGAHREEMLRNPSREELSVLMKHAAVIRRVTLAPELPGSLEAVRLLAGAGITVSAGHSDATWREAEAGFAAGISQVTHLHNAMSSLRRHGSGDGGLADAALAAPGVLCELIADGVHVPDGLLREAYQAKGWRGIVLVSDATAGAGLPEGASFTLGGLTCRLAGGSAWTGEGGQRRLAGSAKALFEGVRTMAVRVRVPIEEAVAMATIVPALSLGLHGRIGSIVPGKQADLIRFSPDWALRGVWIAGEKIAEA